MAKMFLEYLNGVNRGPFHFWLQSLNREPRIAWYPSSGVDYRDLLFLSKQFQEHQPVALDPEPPDIFIHTDYQYDPDRHCNGSNLHSDDRTKIRVLDAEELPRLDVCVDKELVHFDASPKNGRARFMQLEVISGLLGVFTRPLIYICAENTASCFKEFIGTVTVRVDDRSALSV